MVDDFGVSDVGMNDDDTDGDDQVPVKRPRLNDSDNSVDVDIDQGDSEYEASCHVNEDHNVKPVSTTERSFSERLLEKMGHQPGTGLGKRGQGIVEPIKVSVQKGTRGLGFVPKELDIHLSPEDEGIAVEEKVDWLINPYSYDNLLQMDGWMKKEEQKLRIDDETQYCDENILHDILEAKEKFDTIDDTLLQKIRSRANPFEAIGRGIFMNRAAMKMANMDRVFGFMFTEPKDKDGNKVVGEDDLLYFADVCAGPGGFSEYIFFRKKWRAKGFGFTLKKCNDFKLEDFLAGPSETFEPHYGEDDDGDIYKPHNIKSFASFVLDRTNGEGVHFMMADGGFKVKNKSIQEIESKKLYLCQCLVALKIVRRNGNFVCKLFDLFTPFSVGLVYLMYRSFDKISIHKPNSSRPANSERYLICQYKKDESSYISDYLWNVCVLLWEMQTTEEDILQLVPQTVLQKDKDFVDYITSSNNRIGKRQIHHLRNVIYYHRENTGVADERQEDFRLKCLEYWNIPNDMRTERSVSVDEKLRKLFGEGNTDFIGKTPQAITDITTFVNDFKSRQLYGVVIANEEENPLTFFLGLGKKNIFRCVDKAGKKVWTKWLQHGFQLPEGTLIYGEMVEEIKCSASVKGQTKVYVLHVIDGFFLGGEDIRTKHITEREKYCKLFVRSLQQSSISYRKKDLIRYEELNSVLSSSINYKSLKRRGKCFCYEVEENKFFIPRGVLFFCGITYDDWELHYSKKQKRNYYYNRLTGASKWESEMKLHPDLKIPSDVIADFRTCLENSRIWPLDEGELSRLSGQQIQMGA